MKVNGRAGLTAYRRARRMIGLALAGIVKLDFDMQPDGKAGIAQHPDFQRNHWIFLFYTPSTPSVFKLTRFTAVNGALDMKTAKDILTVPNGMTASRHTGGAMDFDAYGDLWITIGNNSPDQPELVSEADWEMSAEASSGNAGDLRGSILRIHPDDSPRGYGIPKGNFGEYWSVQFAAPIP